MSEKKTTRSVLVSWDFSNGKDEGILLVGAKEKNQAVTIVNAFKGQEAWDLYQKLTTITPKKG